MPCAAHLAEGVAADRARPGQPVAARGLATREPARNAPRARPGDRARRCTLVTRLARATSLAEVRWLEARQGNNFALFAPHLEEVVALTRDKAQVLSKALGLAPYDALIDGFSPGFLSADIDQLFRVVEPSPADADPRRHRTAVGSSPPLPLAGKFGVVEAARAGARGHARARLPVPPRPPRRGESRVHGRRAGATSASRRVSTCRSPFTALMGVLHETGQAMYDLGLPAAWRDQPVGRDRGMALEESQSLLLEMIIGRSRPFLRVAATAAREALRLHRPGMVGREPLPHADARASQRDARRRRRAHVPGAHHGALRAREGDLRRHAAGPRACPRRGARRSSAGSACGRRPTPTAACRTCTGRSARSDISRRTRSARSSRPSSTRACAPRASTSTTEIAAGRFGGLFDWLRRNVHARGASVGALELIQEATGKPLSAAPWLRYAEVQVSRGRRRERDRGERRGGRRRARAASSTPLAASGPATAP